MTQLWFSFPVALEIDTTKNIYIYIKSELVRARHIKLKRMKNVQLCAHTHTTTILVKCTQIHPCIHVDECRFINLFSEQFIKLISTVIWALNYGWTRLICRCTTISVMHLNQHWSYTIFYIYKCIFRSFVRRDPREHIMKLIKCIAWKMKKKLIRLHRYKIQSSDYDEIDFFLLRPCYLE